MNIYHLYLKDGCDYDEWSDLVVVASSAEDARTMALNFIRSDGHEKADFTAPPEQLWWKTIPPSLQHADRHYQEWRAAEIDLIGFAEAGIPTGVLVNSFHAG